MPLFIEPLSGNNSDKNSFHETIKKVQEFQKQINVEKNFKWVADSAFYAEDKLLKNNEKSKIGKRSDDNLNELRIKIVRFFGYTACQMYGLIQKSPGWIVSMYFYT